VRNRLRDTVRDEELRAQLTNIDATAESALVSGSKLKPLPEADPLKPISLYLAAASVEVVADAPPQSISPPPAQAMIEPVVSTAPALTKAVRPTLVSMIDAIRTELHMPKEIEIWRVLHEGERLCCHDGDASAGTLMERASHLMDVIGIGAA